jgi:menaquinone-9 beta-reductase
MAHARMQFGTVQPLLSSLSRRAGLMETHFDAVIAGAGPAGSTAAILLAQAGWSVALIEKQPFPRRKVCGECLAASNLPLLHELGVGAAFADLAGPELRHLALMRGNSMVVAPLPAADDAHFQFGRALGRETLDSLLIEQARSSGVQVMQPWSLQSFGGQPGHWHCEMESVHTQAVQTVYARVAIDAHGSWESLPCARHQPPARNHDLLAFKANFLGAALPTGLLPVLCFEGGYGGMVIAGNKLLTLACCVRRDRLAALRQQAPGVSAGLVVEEMLRRGCAGVDNALRDANRMGPWLAAGPLRTGVRLRADDAVYRIGNAAAEAHPIIGEGMSMAFQSAWLLCMRLTAKGSPSLKSDPKWQRSVGRSYTNDWHLHFAQRMRLARAFAYMAMRPTASSLLMRMVRVWPALLSLAARWAGKTRFITTTRKTP